MTFVIIHTEVARYFCLVNFKKTQNMKSLIAIALGLVMQIATAQEFKVQPESSKLQCNRNFNFARLGMCGRNF